MLDLVPGSGIEIVSCGKDALNRPTAEVEITSSTAGGGPYFARVRFESTDGVTSYGDGTADGFVGESGGPQVVATVRVTAVLSAPTAVKCELRNGSVDVTSSPNPYATTPYTVPDPALGADFCESFNLLSYSYESDRADPTAASDPSVAAQVQDDIESFEYGLQAAVDNAPADLVDLLRSFEALRLEDLRTPGRDAELADQWNEAYVELLAAVGGRC